MSWLHRAGLALLAAKALAIPLALDPLAADVFALPKSAASRAIAYALLAVLVAYVLRHRREIRWTWLYLPIAAFVLANAAATAFGVHVPTALYGAPRRFLGLTSILDGAILAVSIGIFVRGPREVALLLASVFAAAAIVVSYASLQLLGLDPIRWSEPLVVSGTIGNTGAFAGYAVIVAALATVALVVWRGELARWQLLGLGALAIAAAIEVLFSGARGPTLALLVAVPAAVAVGLRASLRRPTVPVVLLGFGALAALAVVVAVSPAAPKIARMLAGGDASTAERVLIYRAGFEALLARPLLGAGPDGFIAIYPTVRPPEISGVSGVQVTQSSTHSWFLHQAVGGGVLGLGAALGLVASALLTAWRRRASSIAATVGTVGLAAFLFQGAFNIAHVASEWLFWWSIGLVVAAATERGSVEAPAPRRTRAERYRSGVGDRWAALVAIAIGLALASTVLNSVLASRAVQGSNLVRAKGDFARAEQLAQVALAHDAGRADHWNVLGLARDGRSLEDAVRAFARAVEAAPYEPVYLFNLAGAEARLAPRVPRYRALAVEHALAASRFDPRDPASLIKAAEILAAAGEPREGIAFAERSIALAPKAPTYYERAAQIYASTGDNSRAAERAVRAAEIAGDPASMMKAAQFVADLGKPPEAAALADRAIALAPTTPTYYERASQLYVLAGDYSAAAERLEQYVAVVAPSGVRTFGRFDGREMRLRLARLHQQAGNVGRVRELVPPPKVTEIDRVCSPTHGRGLVVEPEVDPRDPSSYTGFSEVIRCFRVVFAADEALQSDPSRPDAANARSNYAIDGRELPVGTEVIYEPERQVATVQLPPGSVPPAHGSTITVRRVADLFGSAIVPDPTSFRLP